jgi:hypothetical protein
MEMSFFLDFLIFTIILFLFKKKRFHVVQYLFVFLIMVFLYSSFISIIVDNLELWKLQEKPLQYTIFRLAEIILFPVIALWFLELFYLKANKIYKCLMYTVFLFIPVLLEKWLFHIKVLEFKKWEIYQTILAWFIFYFVSLLIHYLIGKRLIKEGVINDTSVS